MQAIIRHVQVGDDGAIQLPRLEIARGKTVEVIVLFPDNPKSDDLLAASETSLAFWDNETDDVSWNHV